MKSDDSYKNGRDAIRSVAFCTSSFTTACYDVSNMIPAEHDASSFTFDDQAESFDRRAGLPAASARDVALVLQELLDGSGLVIDIGAGTGEIGSVLASGSSSYVGIDISAPMLFAFRRKLGPHSGCLVQADAGRGWPIVSGQANLVFSSRAAHLLPPELFVRETLRVAHPAGAVVALGSVKREQGSLRADLRREMRRLLAAAGIRARGGRRARETLVASFETHGARPFRPRRVASWSVSERPADSLRAWREKSGLAGRSVPEQIKDDILRHLEDWSQKRHGEPTTSRQTVEHYELSGVCLPGRSTSENVCITDIVRNKGDV